MKQLKDYMKQLKDYEKTWLMKDKSLIDKALLK